MAAAVRILVSLFLMLHLSRAQGSSDNSFNTFIMLFSLSPQSFASLLLLGLTVVLSGSIYLWVLRYICLGCCQPVAVARRVVTGDMFLPTRELARVTIEGWTLMEEVTPHMRHEVSPVIEGINGVG
ncbi:hypothetical protein INR49_017200 [Xyrichtys novacula]|uniref:Uncharacterized protein n=1 Tax=Xyrichtys novacula TaxID=13765 RepID=A0AAV1HIZ5_XYRNO|nr:hypothetical protein INR49_017200 [Xyrichtys novacula]